VDSEHSAIFQCLQGNEGKEIKKILLTASGGPFRGWSLDQLESVTLAQALKHPKWTMGQKMTIDSASMMNKGLEVIEAKWLFDVPLEKIQILVHPQSIVHSAVRFCDGGVIAQMGVPDMRLPILYAMTYPVRMETGARDLDLAAVATLTFEEADTEKFPSITLAREALRAEGIMCCVLNAANEVAVDAFLKEKIRFGDIYSIVSEVMNKTENRAVVCLEDVLSADRTARTLAADYISKLVVK
jgi:1-deoxy-D-xylulose-5-phosphate reductoisomerase